MRGRCVVLWRRWRGSLTMTLVLEQRCRRDQQTRGAREQRTRRREARRLCSRHVLRRLWRAMLRPLRGRLQRRLRVAHPRCSQGVLVPFRLQPWIVPRSFLMRTSSLCTMPWSSILEAAIGSTLCLGSGLPLTWCATGRAATTVLPVRLHQMGNRLHLSFMAIACKVL